MNYLPYPMVWASVSWQPEPKQTFRSNRGKILKIEHISVLKDKASTCIKFSEQRSYFNDPNNSLDSYKMRPKHRGIKMWLTPYFSQSFQYLPSLLGTKDSNSFPQEFHLITKPLGISWKNWEKKIIYFLC